MFFNIPEEWGMSRMWMIFKRYGTVFDMFMVKRRLRNEKRYGFVRFKDVIDVEILLGQLQKIKMEEDWLKVFIAYDRRNNSNMGMREGQFRRVNGWHNSNNGGSFRGEGYTYRDNRRFVDVVNGECNKDGAKSSEKVMKGENVQQNSKEGFTLVKEEKETRRTIEVEEKDINNSIMARSVVGEVKARCFLAKLPVLCDEQGLGGIEVKLLGGLEVMLVTENENMAANVLSDKDHGLKRWLYKLRTAEVKEKRNRDERMTEFWDGNDMQVDDKEDGEGSDDEVEYKKRCFDGENKISKNWEARESQKSEGEENVETVDVNDGINYNGDRDKLVVDFNNNRDKAHVYFESDVNR
nr:transposon TX1 [Tanacetum cinerariifolium]